MLYTPDRVRIQGQVVSQFENKPRIAQITRIEGHSRNLRNSRLITQGHSRLHSKKKYYNVATSIMFEALEF